jgi:hypothetical protein
VNTPQEHMGSPNSEKVWAAGHAASSKPSGAASSTREIRGPAHVLTIQGTWIRRTAGLPWTTLATLLRPRRPNGPPSPDRRGTQSPSTLIRADPATPSDRPLPHPRMLGANPGWSPLGRRSPVADLVISSLPKAVQRGSACSTTSRACARSGNGYRAPLSMIRSARCAGPACWSTGYWKRSA